MRCPFCASVENRVVDSRMARDGRAIRRRRQCEGCGDRFTTYEEVEAPLADVEKRGGLTEPFSREKLTRSLRLACKKRPVALTTLTEFAARLETMSSARARKTVTSQEIGDAVLAFLRDLDPVAYVRYASVYRSFATIDEFTRELQTFRPSSALDAAPGELEDGEPVDEAPADAAPSEDGIPRHESGIGLVEPL
ncbi:MAG: transcriptional repressor NrdR [Deltaproteobacteria bacterium]|nr:MAG: transcriptional repressor NrdR [Deltaproteobacteria bacterium]